MIFIIYLCMVYFLKLKFDDKTLVLCFMVDLYIVRFVIFGEEDKKVFDDD